MTKKIKILKTEDKKRILNSIRLALKKEFNGNILNAAVYGSMARDDYDSKSDFDLLVVFRKISSKDIERLRKIRLRFLKNKIILDFNIHIFSELPQIRKKGFWHHNRSFFMQKELQMYNRQIIGKNLFDNVSFTKKEIELEALRLINSALYEARGILANENVKYEQKIRIIKSCIYATDYALAFFGKYQAKRKETFDLFHPLFKTKINPVYFFDIKTKRIKNISKSDLNKALDFLSELDEKVYAMYKQD